MTRGGTRARPRGCPARRRLAILGRGTSERASILLTALLLGLLGVSALAPGAAEAQLPPGRNQSFETQTFLPSAGGGTTFGIARPEVHRHLGASFGLALSYAYRPFTVNIAGAQTGVVEHLIQPELLAALGLFEFMELGLAFPFAFADAAPFLEELPTGSPTRDLQAGLADPRLSLKVPILRGEISLAARFVASLPLSQVNEARPDAATGSQGTRYLGSTYWTATPSLVFAWNPGPLRLGAELGYRMRQRQALPDRTTAPAQYEQDDELQIAAGVAVPIIHELELLGELRSGFGLSAFSYNDQNPGSEIPLDLHAGARILPIPGLTIEVGVGGGLAPGVGSPAFRALTVVRYATISDLCEAGPEDYDGFEDGDFCADPDNDADGLEDQYDQCPNDAEDIDEFEDTDGCPDIDNDADGVLDERDSCPTESEDRDGFQEEDGCPEPDNDDDGLPDGRDQCPNDPEDRDNFEDQDGCPEPGPDRAAVTVTDTRILISERIYFDYDGDTIRSVSRPMLDQVAAVIRDLPRRRRIRVEGHTDNQGNAAYNLDLSFRRARAVVEYLVSQGVPRARLEYRGYGSTHSVAPNDAQEGRALNRRVEFSIIE